MMYLVPSLGAFIGIFSVLLTYFCLWHTLRKSKKELLDRISGLLEEMKWKDACHNILTEKLEGFMQDLRQQIPMGQMLLTPALSGKIKEIVKEGILKMLPDMKEQLLNKVSQNISFEKVILKSFMKELVRIIVYAALLGFFAGLLWTFFEQR